MDGPLEVVPYSIDALKRILGREVSAPVRLDRNLHVIYFEEYFDRIGAQTIVVERAYVDRDYLEDYASYYVKCFHPYQKWCERLHFFDIQFTSESLDALLEGDESVTLSLEDLQSHYLGFVVVKPLPRRNIGRTCLKTYPLDGRRVFATTRDYEVTLAGMPLRVKQTLAFQEQDSVIAACATSALWSAFHSTGKVFQHAIPTPVEITKAATEDEPSDTRNFPNKGLLPSQVARAIRSVGLEPFLVSASDPAVLRNTVYAYLSGRVPLILGFRLFDRPERDGPWEWFGNHAVAVTGFGRAWETATPELGSGLLLEASRIDRLYVHDDGVGPFARMVMDEKSELFLIPGQGIERCWSLITSWGVDRGKDRGMRALPWFVMAPLYPKIRIPYQAVERVVREFDQVLTAAADGALDGQRRLTWDIKLGVGPHVKTAVIEEGVLKGKRRREFLERGLPRFVWRATARQALGHALDLLFDATDIEEGNLLLHAVAYDAETSEIAAIAANEYRSEFGDLQCASVLEWFLPPESSRRA